MKAPRDLLSVQLETARKQREAALAKVVKLDAVIEDLQARRTARHTQDLRRKAHWPKRVSRAEREIDLLIDQEAPL